MGSTTDRAKELIATCDERATLINDCLRTQRRKKKGLNVVIVLLWTAGGILACFYLIPAVLLLLVTSAIQFFLSLFPVIVMDCEDMAKLNAYAGSYTDHISDLTNLMFDYRKKKCDEDYAFKQITTLHNKITALDRELAKLIVIKRPCPVV